LVLKVLHINYQESVGGIIMKKGNLPTTPLNSTSITVKENERQMICDFSVSNKARVGSKS
jgi:hypothetical protein